MKTTLNSKKLKTIQVIEKKTVQSTNTAKKLIKGTTTTNKTVAVPTKRKRNQEDGMQIKQTASFYKDVFIYDYEYYPAERLQRKRFTNLSISIQVDNNEGSPVLFGTDKLPGTSGEPPKLLQTLHKNMMPLTRFRDNELITTERCIQNSAPGHITTITVHRWRTRDL